MLKHWLGLLILALWAWSAIAAIAGWWVVAYDASLVWTGLVALFVIRGFCRAWRRLCGGSCEE